MAEKTKELKTNDSIIAVLALYQPQEESVLSGIALRKAFLQLSREYPEDFPNLFFSDESRIPLSKELEDTFFQLGAWRIWTYDLHENYRITHETKQALVEGLKSNCSEEEMTHFVVLSQRFNELIEKSKS